MNFSLLIDLAELCARKGVRHAVLCPGSRSAPLTLAFKRNKAITCWTFSDERSAAFAALGLAQQTKNPVALVCTSGSAAYNFAPAVAEAYFQQIPLIVLTADRPQEWIDQFDGQTIRQKELYGKHVKKYFELPQDYSHPDATWHANRLVNEALNLALAAQRGPVHINAPFREPLYPSASEKFKKKEVRVIESLPAIGNLSPNEWNQIKQKLSTFKKILVVVGQQEGGPALSKAIINFSVTHPWAFAGDILSNMHGLPDFCRYTDTFLGQIPENTKASLRPDLLITFGKSLVAKNLKLFLRKYQPQEHWHLQTTGDVADTFQALTKIIPVEPTTFFAEVKSLSLKSKNEWATYKLAWQESEKIAKLNVDSFFQKKRKGEFDLVKRVIESLPARCHLHLANSMSVRYANHIGLSSSQKDVAVFSNRGTSGIDGCSSTAIGHSLGSSSIPNVLITGDMAFFYDRNAFWHNYPVKNLFIVVLNNHGGIIFNLIDGPGGLAEASEFFITKQKLNAKSLASEYGFDHKDASKTKLKGFFKPGKSIKILEIESSQSENKSIFESFKKHIRKSYEH